MQPDNWRSHCHERDYIYDDVQFRNKTCTVCRKTYPASVLYFGYSKNGRYWLKSNCLSCEKQYRAINAEQARRRSSDYYQKTKPEKQLKQQENAAQISQWQKTYRANNQEALRQWRRRYWEKRKHNIYVKLSRALRRRCQNSIKRGSITAKTKQLLGCTAQEFKQYLELRFTEGMTWENYGIYGWHIDHIIPISSFDLNDESQQAICFHYTNMQPLWAKDNRAKWDKINWTKGCD